VTGQVGRPRNPEINETLRDCSIHGRVEHRQHKFGKLRDGRQRYRWTCMLCHAAKSLAGHHRRKEA